MSTLDDDGAQEDLRSLATILYVLAGAFITLVGCGIGVYLLWLR